MLTDGGCSHLAPDPSSVSTSVCLRIPFPSHVRRSQRLDVSSLKTVAEFDAAADYTSCNDELYAVQNYRPGARVQSGTSNTPREYRESVRGTLGNFYLFYRFFLFALRPHRCD